MQTDRPVERRHQSAVEEHEFGHVTGRIYAAGRNAVYRVGACGMADLTAPGIGAGAGSFEMMVPSRSMSAGETVRPTETVVPCPPSSRELTSSASCGC